MVGDGEPVGFVTGKAYDRLEEVRSQLAGIQPVGCLVRQDEAGQLSCWSLDDSSGWN